MQGLLDTIQKNIEFVGISNGLRTPDVFNGTDSYEELYLVKLGGGLDE